MLQVKLSLARAAGQVRRFCGNIFSILDNNSPAGGLIETTSGFANSRHPRERDWLVCGTKVKATL